MQIALIAALGQRSEIGRDGGLPWSPSDDLRRFKQLTIGKPVLMGRRTHESIGGPLPGRTNIVLSSRTDYRADGCMVADSARRAVELAERAPGPDLAMVIGGASLYDTFLPRTDRLFLTVIYASFDASDTFFPRFDPAEWLIEDRTDRTADDLIAWRHAFFSLRRYRDKPLTAESVSEPTRVPDMLAPLSDCDPAAD